MRGANKLLIFPEVIKQLFSYQPVYQAWVSITAQGVAEGSCHSLSTFVLILLIFAVFLSVAYTTLNKLFAFLKYIILI